MKTNEVKLGRKRQNEVLEAMGLICFSEAARRLGISAQAFSQNWGPNMRVSKMGRGRYVTRWELSKMVGSEIARKIGLVGKGAK
jgi:hypothetical protein